MLTAEVTSYSCNGERKTPRKEMEKGFLLNGVNVSGNKLFIDQTVEGSSSIFPNLTDTSFTVRYDAVMIAQAAFYFLVL